MSSDVSIPNGRYSCTHNQTKTLKDSCALERAFRLIIGASGHKEVA